jgi:hypothetical protein
MPTTGVVGPLDVPDFDMPTTGVVGLPLDVK